MIKIEIRQAANGWIVELYGYDSDGPHVFQTFDEVTVFVHVWGQGHALTDSNMRIEPRE